MKTWTTLGIVDLFVLLFLHPEARKAFVEGLTANLHAKRFRYPDGC